MTEAADKRPVPHLNLTPALQASIATVHALTDDRGTKVCENPADIDQVRRAIRAVSQWFDDPAFYAGDEASEVTVCDHLILLLNCLREHHRAGDPR